MSKKILLISDTHNFFDSKIIPYLDNCDELWHAGDIGELNLEELVPKQVVLRAVHGNIDVKETRIKYPEKLLFTCEDMRVLIRHIGGRPGKYTKDALADIRAYNPSIFICGHSHILLVQNYKELGHLYLNPGAAGREGFHKMRTMLRLEIADGTIKALNVIELGKRGER